MAVADETADTDLPRAEPLSAEGLVQAHQAAIWRQLRALGARPETAADLAQETFLLLLQQQWQDRGPLALRTWLRRTAHNLFLAHCRRQRQAPPMVDPVALEQAWQRADRGDDGEGYRQALTRCLDGMPTADRDLLLRASSGDVPLLALAAERQQHVEALRALLRRWKLGLRHCMERRLRDDE